MASKAVPRVIECTLMASCGEWVDGKDLRMLSAEGLVAVGGANLRSHDRRFQGEKRIHRRRRNSPRRRFCYLEHFPSDGNAIRNLQRVNLLIRAEKCLDSRDRGQARAIYDKLIAQEFDEPSLLERIEATADAPRGH